MMDEILEKIRLERIRQYDLPGSEWDAKLSPGEWVALVSHYVSEEVKRNGQTPKASDFEDAMIKAAAVIIASLENLNKMKDRKELS